MTSKQFLKTFTNTLRFHRKNMGLTQVQLAEKLSLNHRHFQKIESGQVDLKCSTISSLAEAFKIPACYLFENSDAHTLKSIKMDCPCTILNMLSVGVLVNEPTGLINYANKIHAEALGLKQHEVAGKKYIWDFLHDEKDKSELKTYLAHIVENKPEPTPYFAKNKSSDGGFVPVKVEWNYIFDNSKTIIGFISIINYHPSW